MPPDVWLTLGKIVAAIGGSGTLIALLKWLWDQGSGRTARRTRVIRDAISAMRDAAEWAEAYWEIRSWCRQSHGYDPSMPKHLVTESGIGYRFVIEG